MGDTAARGRPGAGDDSAAEGAPAAEAELRTQDAAAARLCVGRMRAADSRAAGRQGPGSRVSPHARPYASADPREVAQGSQGAPRAKRRAALSVLHINGGNTWDAPVQ